MEASLTKICQTGKQQASYMAETRVKDEGSSSSHGGRLSQSYTAKPWIGQQMQNKYSHYRNLAHTPAEQIKINLHTHTTLCLHTSF